MIKTCTFVYFITSAAMKKLADYMHYIDNGYTHPLASIAVRGLSTRTNKDTEGYHRILNKRVGDCHINIYKLINIVYKEASDIKITK